MNSPNLFTFATRELSQDAVICWLASWAQANKMELNESLHKTGVYFLNKLFDKHDKKAPNEYTSIEIKQQDNYIDVLIVVNNKYVILVEDKTGSQDHSDQLERYLNRAKEKYEGKEIIPIYFKTGDQCNYQYILDKGYKIYLRKDFLEVLNFGKSLGINNDVFRDFHSYLQGIEDSVESYKKLPLDKWHCYYSWVGFFKHLQSHLEVDGWSYVNNPNGGFMGLWWNSHKDNGTYKYLQLENEKLCFKIEVEDKEKQSEQRNAWSDEIINIQNKFGLEIKRPNRFGKGKWMTVAEIEDYRKVDESGIINIEETLRFLQLIQTFHDSLLRKRQQ